MEKSKEEIMDWKNKDEGVMRVITRMPIIDGDKEIGTSETKQVLNVNMDGLRGGMAIYEERIEKNKKELGSLKGQLDSLGNIPKLNQRLKQYQKDMQSLGLIEASEQLKKQIKPIKEQIKEDEGYLDKRKKLLAGRPTEGKMVEEETKKEEESVEEKKEEETPEEEKKDEPKEEAEETEEKKEEETPAEEEEKKAE